MIRLLSFSFFTVLLFSCGSNSSDTRQSEINSETNNDSSEVIIDTTDKVILDKIKEYQNQINSDSSEIIDMNIVDSLENELYGPDLKGIQYSDKKESKKEKTSEKVKRKKKEENNPTPLVKPIITETKEVKTPVSTPQVKAEIHKTWDDLLRKHVSSSGKVNYTGFVKDKDEVLKYIKELQSFHKDVDSWDKNKRLAYWINVYNAVTVKLITDNYPVKSITDLHGGKPWDQKLINLGGISYTLNVIENKIIRPKYNEPRIHFAVNCAAKSCPKIMNKAWTEDNIQRYLTKQTKAFIANTTENNISADKVELSKIFDWYKADFGGNDVKLIEFINKYSDIKVNEGTTVNFNEYNWKLNN